MFGENTIDVEHFKNIMRTQVLARNKIYLVISGRDAWTSNETFISLLVLLFCLVIA